MVQLNYIAGHTKVLAFPAGQCLIRGFSIDFGPWTAMPIQTSWWTPKKVIGLHFRKTDDWCVKEQKNKVFTSEKPISNQIGLRHRMTSELPIKIHV